jgi:hypothetical protein
MQAIKSYTITNVEEDYTLYVVKALNNGVPTLYITSYKWDGSFNVSYENGGLKYVDDNGRKITVCIEDDKNDNYKLLYKMADK